MFLYTFGYLFGITLKLGVLGIWLGMYMDWIVRTIVYIIRLKGIKWKNKNVINQKEQPKTFSL